MLKDNLLDILQKHQKDLQEFGVQSRALFGSVVRDEARAESDVVSWWNLSGRWDYLLF
jgi:uncharacterized protein